VLAQHAPQAADRINRLWRTKLKTYPERREENRVKSKTRSRVEHVFATMKLQFGFVKVRFRTGQELKQADDHMRSDQPVDRPQIPCARPCSEPRLKS
jgi:hypothetical protein